MSGRQSVTLEGHMRQSRALKAMAAQHARLCAVVKRLDHALPASIGKPGQRSGWVWLKDWEQFAELVQEAKAIAAGKRKK